MARAALRDEERRPGRDDRSERKDAEEEKKAEPSQFGRVKKSRKKVVGPGAKNVFQFGWDDEEDTAALTESLPVMSWNKRR